jgi:signal transduction histidine kinase
VKVVDDGEVLDILLRRPPYHIVDLDAEPPLPQVHRERLQREGAVPLLIGPLVLGEQAVASVSLRFHAAAEIRPAQFQLAQALGHPATLGGVMTQPAEPRRSLAVLDERMALARDLHDMLAQVFTSIALQLDLAHGLVEQDSVSSQVTIVGCGDIAREGLVEARRSVLALPQKDGIHSDLVPVLDKTVPNPTAGTPFGTRPTIAGRPRALSPATGLSLVGIVQKAFINARRHSDCTSIAVGVRFHEGAVGVVVSDDGGGMAGVAAQGAGLAKIRAGGAWLDGPFDITTGGSGTENRVMVPA